MLEKIKWVLPAVMAVLTAFLSASPVHAAAPDGLGPWADTVVSTTQGSTKAGAAVPAIRSDATSMLGVAENDTTEGHFYSLGFGGTATLGFDNGISNGMFVVEATNLGYPAEQVSVDVSDDGVNFTPAGTLSQDGTVNVPAGVQCVHFVRLTDTSNPADFSDGTADGYDVDGVMADGDVCQSRFTGGGSLWTAGGTRVTHGMELSCDASLESHLQMNWGKGNKFHLEDLTSSVCSDDPSIDAGNPASLINTIEGAGTGKYNGTSGYHIAFKFSDAGEPGTGDKGWVEIWDPTHTTKVLDVPWSNLKNGNQQAH